MSGSSPAVARSRPTVLAAPARIAASLLGGVLALSLLLAAGPVTAAFPDHINLELDSQLTRKPTAPAPATPTTTAPPSTATPGTEPGTAPGNPPGIAPLVLLGVGDSVSLQVYGKPDLSTTVVVSEDGTIQVPLAGPVEVKGLSPAQASQKVAKAFQDGEFLINPQVSITLDKGTSQQVSVLGEVGGPGRYPVESRTTVFDLLAQAGGKAEDSSDIIFLLRTDENGKVTRTPIDLSSLSNPNIDFPTIKFQGGDTLYVPRGEQVFIYGEVNNPGKVKLDPGMTLVQALTLVGGVTRRGSTSRIEIKRKKPGGGYLTVYPKLNDKLEPDDVIRVKESIF